MHANPINSELMALFALYARMMMSNKTKVECLVALIYVRKLLKSFHISSIYFINFIEVSNFNNKFVKLMS